MAEPFEAGGFKPPNTVPADVTSNADAFIADYFPISRPGFAEQQRAPAKGKHSEEPDDKDGHKDADLTILELGEVAGKSFVHSSIEETANGLGQLVNAVADRHLIPEVKIFDPQTDADMGSERWYAQSIGGGAGAVLPFIATEMVTRRAGSTDLFSHIRGAADNVPALRAILGKENASHWISPWSKSVMDGGIYGAALSPAADDKHDFWQQRGVNGLTASICFGTQFGVSHGLVAGLEKGGIGHAHFDAQHGFDAKTAVGHVAANVTAGTAAGFVGAESYSLLSSGHTANKEFVQEAMAKFAITGLSLETVHLGASTIVARAKADGHDSAPAHAADVAENRSEGASVGHSEESSDSGAPIPLPTEPASDKDH